MKTYQRILFLLLYGMLIMITQATIESRDYENKHYYVFQFSDHTDPVAFSNKLGFDYERPLISMEDHHLVSISKEVPEEDIDKRISLYMDNPNAGPLGELQDKILFCEKQKLKMRHSSAPAILPKTPKSLHTRSPDPKREKKIKKIMKKLKIKDPYFLQQWYLYNLERKHHDLNVVWPWLKGYTGKGVTVAIVDDGVDFNNTDLKLRYCADGSYDFDNHSIIPIPFNSENDHGTKCAGIVGASKNNFCGLGIAYKVKLSALRILGGFKLQVDEANALTYRYDLNSIYSCSWGSPENGATIDGPSPLVQKALVKGISKGRNGYGSIYVFASGNGGNNDNCNFDGYANSIYTITIGAIDKNNEFVSYSEPCVARHAVTYTGTKDGSIYTTELGKKGCTSKFEGTSTAAPLAAGIIALALQARPELSWRDMQLLIIETSRLVHPEDNRWEATQAGRKYHDYYGYGLMDANKLVKKAKTWDLLGPATAYSTYILEKQQELNSNKKRIESKIYVTKEMVLKSNIKNLEHVTVTMKLFAVKRGDVVVTLISPNGIISRLATMRPWDFYHGIYSWTFTSLKHWGETFEGEWTLIITLDTTSRMTHPDWHHLERRITFYHWYLTFHGEAKDAATVSELTYYGPKPSETLSEPLSENVLTDTLTGSDPAITYVSV